ncbi:restriction endonuclease subunit S [Marinomonas sp. FW-1]|uniref:restriction endonuclease subunit S n=1 Tax=Marinomonas sp. FW-1 TaxID=2071621 RepID=UPI0010C05FBF|nr:restriction endonuclease subunit S [Marinomonas sp. FW-1]
MSELPKGWSEACFDEVLESISNGISNKQNQEQSGIPVSRIETIAKEKFDFSKIGYVDGFDEEKLPKYRINKKDILFSHINSPIHLGKTAIFNSDKELFHGTNLLRLVVNNSLYKPELFNYYCKFYRAIGGFVSIAQHAVNQSSLNQKKLKACTLPLAPLAEQKRIVEKLDQVLAQVDTIKARLDDIPAILKRFRQSVLAAAVSGKLTEEWRVRETLINAVDEIAETFSKKKGRLKLRGNKFSFNDISLIDLPTSWCWIENYKLARDSSNAICAGPFGTIFKAKDFRDEGVPIIFLRHVKEIGFNQRKPNFMDREVWKAQHQDYSVYGGELLVTKLGDPPGECCIYPENFGISMVTPDVLKMDVDELSANKKYLMFYFNSPMSTEIIEKLAFGVTRLRIDIAMFKGFPVPLPSLKEQAEIVRLVDQYFAFADTIEKQVQKAQQRVDKLTQSILAKAFRGELVPQDPNDEPADQLLKRIAAARAESEALAKAAKKVGKKK